MMMDSNVPSMREPSARSPAGTRLVDDDSPGNVGVILKWRGTRLNEIHA